MEWQAVVLALQILLLAAGWLLFQRARGELSARAAETPVLAEVRALQKNVKQLLQEINSASERQSLRLEGGCAEASGLLIDLNEQMRDAERILETLEEKVRAAELNASSAGSRFLEPTLAEARPLPAEQISAVAGWRAPRLPEILSAAADVSPAGSQGAESLRNQSAAVFHLSDTGETPAAIAARTRLSEGEVEMMLSLRGKGAPSPAR